MRSSGPSFSVFLDANVLAKPLTRTLLVLAGGASGYGTTWSEYVEVEANRNLRPRQRSVTEVRELAGQELSEAGEISGRFTATAMEDRQVLADAAKAGALFIVTEDVDDFDVTDLKAYGIAAVNPDLFLAACSSEAGYLDALEFIAALSRNPRLTPEELHVRLGRAHPHTVQAHRLAFSGIPMRATHRPPAVLYRGDRCLKCLQVVNSVTSRGVCQKCGQTAENPTESTNPSLGS